MQDLVKMRVVYVRKNAQELPVYMFHSGGKSGWKFVSCLGGKRAFVVEKILTPCHYVVDVGWCRQLHTFAIMVYPCVAQAVLVK
jgi:hypothetical protein